MGEFLSAPNKDKHSKDRENDFVNLLLTLSLELYGTSLLYHVYFTIQNNI